MEKEKIELLKSRLRSIRGVGHKENSFDPDNGGLFCWGFVNWGYRIAAEIFGMPGLILSTDVYEAEKNFRMLKKGELPQFLDIIVLRYDNFKTRHVGLVIEGRWFMHCSEATGGIGCSEWTRDPWRIISKHFGRNLLLEGQLC
jgi:hypothetical protein